MATINAPASERRHLSDRRTTGSTHKVKLNAIDWIAMVLMIVGGLNWGLVGMFDFNLVAALFGSQTPLSRIVYVVVGLASLYGIYLTSKMAAERI
jgi:uncharacterized membrane protein YuzA (DUF378 family)